MNEEPTPEPIDDGYFTLPKGEQLRPGDQIHPATVTPEFARDDAWHTLEEGTVFIGGEVGKLFAGILLTEGGFRRLRCKHFDPTTPPPETLHENTH